MGLTELLILAIALSMDAFAVSVCKGLATERVRFKHMAISGAWFGGFQALMPLIGFLLGSAFERYVKAVDHWIAFMLLGAIGVNMLKEAFSEEDTSDSGDFGFKSMLVMAIATSIDALAVGITFALLPDVNIAAAVTFIGITTFLLSALGVKIGSAVGGKYKNRAQLAGGAILILLGIKILIEHLTEA